MSRADRSHRRAELRPAAVAEKGIQTGGGASTDVIRLQPGRDGLWASLTWMWARRELLAMFTRRDLQVRYKQAVLGAGWAVLQPILTMVVFSVFFGRVAHVPSDGVPYPLFSLAGLVPWTFFANSVTNSTSSLVQNASMLTKIYFP